MHRYASSNIAASAIYLAHKMTKRPKPWDEALERHSQFTEQQVRVCAKELFVLLTEAQTSSLQAVKKKFANPKFGEVSKIKLESSKTQTAPVPSSTAAIAANNGTE